MSVFDSFSATSLAPWMKAIHGEDVVVTPKLANGSFGTPATVKATVLRDRLAPRGTDNGQRLEYAVVVQIAMADYPDGTGGGSGRPNINGDKIDVFVRKGDTVKANKIVSTIISQVGQMWVLGLD